MHVYHDKSVLRTLLVLTSESYRLGSFLIGRRSGDFLTHGYNVVHLGRYCASRIGLPS